MSSHLFYCNSLFKAKYLAIIHTNKPLPKFNSSSTLRKDSNLSLTLNMRFITQLAAAGILLNLVSAVPLFSEISFAEGKRSYGSDHDRRALNAVKPVKELPQITKSAALNAVKPEPEDLAFTNIKRNKAALNADKPTHVYAVDKRNDAALNACRPVAQKDKRAEDLVPPPSCPRGFESIEVLDKRNKAAMNACRPPVVAEKRGEASVPVCPRGFELFEVEAIIEKRDNAALNAVRPKFELAGSEKRGNTALNLGVRNLVLAEKRDNAALNAVRPKLEAAEGVVID